MKRSRLSRRRSYASFRRLSLLAMLIAGIVAPSAQTAGPTGLLASRNVNMVSGDEWPTGDPYLQRQNEPSVGASTRNPLHLLAGANDYRSVDLPGLPDGGETGDAWLGVFKSFDGGERWQSTLLPGYPQDTSPEGLASPLKAYQAGADPVVRPGTNGLLFFAGLAFNRGDGAASGVFVSSFIDNNDKENGDPIAYLTTSMVAKSTGAAFLDKPWMAVDIPRSGAKVCKIVNVEPPPVVMKPRKGAAPPKKVKNPKPPKGKPVTQSVLAGTIYVAYASITTTDTSVDSRLMFSSSDDCGVSWSKPVQLSAAADKVNQGATIAIDPRTGVVYVAWRRFGLSTTTPDSVMVARSATAGKSFETPVKVHDFKAGRDFRQLLAKFKRVHRLSDPEEAATIQPFDSSTADDRFRTNAYPTIAIDDDSRVYLAWTERGRGVARPDDTLGDARVVVATSRNGASWTTPQTVDTGNVGIDVPGHQLMPSIAFSAGTLVIVYYDLREDVSQVFGPFVDETDAITSARRRHTIDIRAARAAKGDVPAFGPSTRVSQYLVGSRPGSTSLEQLQYNPPNLPLFQLGSVPFIGDYIDLAPAPAFVRASTGQWVYNTAAAAAPVFHVVWADNRDVRPPANGDWHNYTPPASLGGSSTFDPSQTAPACIAGQTGMRNQNIYSARLTLGLVAGSPGNTKPLSTSVPRSFVVFAQNTTDGIKSFRLTIASQPPGGAASFAQLGFAGAPPILTSVDVIVAARSLVTRTVYVLSSDAKSQVPVDVQEIGAPGTPILANGLASRVVLNPDISNPDISNPDISNPDISNPDISNAEVYNPDISNPDISNPDISNPDISNPDISNPDISNVVIANPDISNPDISNPDISNPDISNPDISNPDISNPDISNGALSDVTWIITNTGNTTASFNVNLFLADAAHKLGGVKTQLVVHKTYSTPVAVGCEIKTQTQTVLVANVRNPTFKEPGSSTVFDPTNPDISNTTLWLEPGGEGKITLRIIDPDPTDDVAINPVTDVTPVVHAASVNTTNLGDTNPTPPSTEPPAAPDVTLAFLADPTDTLQNTAIAPPVTVLASSGLVPQEGVRITLAIAVNPAAGHLSGTVTALTDASGIATFSNLSIERAGIGYRLSASSSSSGAVPDLSNPFTVYNPYVVTSTVDGGLGSLRSAMTFANAAPDLNTISFAMPGAGPHTITLTSPLPALTQPVVIDATTQPDYDGKPTVVVNAGSTTGAGFELQQAGTIKGLSIVGFDGAGGYAVFIRSGADGSVVEDNIIGTDRNGSTGLGNQFGVYSLYANTAMIRRNTISGNTADGVLIVGGAGAQVRNNRIGLTPDGLSPLPNVGNGVTMYDGATSATFDANLISGNGSWGIDLQQSGALAPVTFTTMTNNVIGLDAAGAVLRVGAADILDGGAVNYGPIQRGNLAGGVRLQEASGTRLGLPGSGNVISGNANGVRIEGMSATPPTLQGNKVGTDATGTLARPNTNDGILIQTGSAATVGGSGVGEGNLISGNLSDGLISDGDSSIVGNFVGTDVTGTLPLGNGWLQSGPFEGCCHTGVLVGNGANTVMNNLVSGNLEGIRSGGGAGDAPNVIDGNKVGTDVTGTVAIPNGEGIGLYGDRSGTTIVRNLVAFSTGIGVRLVEGTVGATVGGPAASDGNTIRNNGAGVVVGYDASAPDRMNRIQSNAIYGNAGPGIDLAGPRANDPGDTDTGPNDLQNFPVLGSAVSTTTTLVDFDLDGLAGSYQVQLFSGATCGAAQTLLATTTVSTGHSVVDLGTLAQGGTYLTATATDSAGNTSELSDCLAVPATPWAGTGPGTLTITDGGSGSNPILSYDYCVNPPSCVAGGVPLTSWDFTTTASASGSVNLTWSYSGLHAWFAVTARLDIIRNGSVIATVVNAGPENCCTTPSNGFAYNGVYLLALTAGDTYGFRISGSNGDLNSFLHGTLNVVVAPTLAPLPDPPTAVNDAARLVASGAEAPRPEPWDPSASGDRSRRRRPTRG